MLMRARSRSPLPGSPKAHPAPLRPLQTGRPACFTGPQVVFLQSMVPTFLALPTRRKNSLRRTFFATALTEFVIRFADELGPSYNVRELTQRINRYFWNQAMSDTRRKTKLARRGIFTTSTDSLGIDVNSADAAVLAELFGRAPKPTKATPFAVFCVDYQDEIDQILEVRMEDIGDPLKTAGERQRIRSDLFNRLSVEKCQEYEVEAAAINAENKSFFDDHVPDQVIFENQTQLTDVLQKIAVATLGRGRSKVGEGMIHVQYALKGPSGPIVNSLSVSTVEAEYTTSNAYKLHKIGETWTNYATAKLYQDELAAAVAVPASDAAAAPASDAAAAPASDAAAAPASDAAAAPASDAAAAPASDAAPVPLELNKAPVPAIEDHDVRVQSTGTSVAPPALSVANKAVVESHTSIGKIQVITGAASASAMDVDHNVDQMNIDASDFIEGSSTSQATPGLSSRVATLDLGPPMTQPDFTSTTNEVSSKKKRGRPAKNAATKVKPAATKTKTKPPAKAPKKTVPKPTPPATRRSTRVVTESTWREAANNIG